MPSLEQCAKKFGKALSANDLDTIREMGGDPQVYLDQLMAEREKYFPQTLSQSDRKVGIKADIGRLSSLLGPQLYGKLEDIGQVTVKELFQNAFDGVKDLGGAGSIEITTDDNANTVTVTDNGIGMTTDTVENAFLTVAGTQKSSDRASGGFGIAKMLFLFGNEEIALETVHDGVRTFFRSTGAEIMEAASGEGEQLNLEVDNVDMPNGTTVVVKIPTEYVDPSTGETKQIYMPNNYNLEDMILNSPLFEDIEVVFNSNILPIGRNFPKDDYTNYANVKFAWGNIRVVVKKDKDDGPSWQSNVSVLSEGIYQFGDDISFGPMFSQAKVPYKFFFNIEPTVAADEVGYPIAINRKGYSHAVQADVDRLKQHISARYAMTDIGEQSNSFGSIEMINPVNGESTFVDLTPKVRTDTQAFVVKQGGTIEVEEGRLVVDGVEVPEFTTRDMEEFVPDMSEFKIDQSLVDPDQPFIHSNVTLDGGPLVDNLRKEFGVDEVNEYLLVFGDVFKELRDMVISVGGGSYQGMEDVPVGVSFDNQYYGVHFKVPFRGMAINPGVTILDEHGPVFKANALLTTMVHEIAHYRYMNHDPATFINENQRLMSLLLSFETIGDNVINITKLKERLSTNIEKHGDIYERLRIGYEDGSVENSGTKLEESARQPIGSPRDDSGTEGESGAGQLDAEGVRQTTGPDTGGNTESGNDGAVDSQPEGPIDDLTGDIVSTPKPLILSQEAQRNEDGFYSAVEQAVLDMNLPEWKKEDGQAKGKVIWQKLVKAAGIKEEETNWMGLEEWLHADPNEKFTRDEVADFINMKGIKVTQVMAGFDEDYDPEEDGYEDIQWDSGTPDNDSENWTHRVDDLLYEYDRSPEDEMLEHFFKKWVSENLNNELFTELLEETIEDTTTEDKGDQEIRVDITEVDGEFKVTQFWASDGERIQTAQEQTFPTREEAEGVVERAMTSVSNDDGVVFLRRQDTTTTTRQNEGFDVTLRDLIEAEDLDGVIEHVGTDAIAPAAREDYEDYAEEQAEEEYMQEPYMEYRSQNTDDNITIHGNDDIGYTIRINNDVHGYGEVHSLNEAQIEAEEHAREYGVEIGEGGGARPSENRPRWGDHISSGASVNYREQKLTMPNIGGDFYHTVHFDDRNVVAFNRMTDRMEGDIKELRLEESQSDWESQARKGEGYQSGANVNDIKEERALIHGQVDQLLDSIYEAPAPLEEFTAEEAEKLIADLIANNPIDPLWNDLLFTIDRGLWTKDFNGIYRSVSPFDSMEHNAELFALGNPFYTAHPVTYARDNKSEFSNAAWTVIRADSWQSKYDDNPDSANSIANIGSALEDNQTLFVELRELVREYDALSGQLAREQSGVVNQPYKGNAWTNLALKYAIKAAIDGGYDQFAWSDNKTIQGTWSPGYSYAAQYDQKMPSMVKKLTGQKARHVQHDGSPLEPVRTLEQLRNETKITEAEAKDMVETSEGPSDGPWFEIIDETGTRVGDLEQLMVGSTRVVDATDSDIEGLIEDKENMLSKMRVRPINDLIDNLNDGDTINFYNGDFVTHHRLLERTADQGKWVIDITDDVKAKFAERQTLMQEDQGQLIIMPDGSRFIKLTESSNMSTFVHEAMHLFVELEKQLAEEFGVMPHHEAMMRFVGATELGQITSATPEGVEMHEKLSRAFENYFREGKAPSVELRDAFSFFSSWLKKIYNYINSEIDVELTDEIKQVFDSMLATDAAILEASTTDAYGGLFASIDQSGMSDAAWEDYQLEQERVINRATETVQTKLMKELAARQTQEWEAEKAPIIEEEIERLSNTPAYKLMLLLAGKKTTDIDGVETESRMNYEMVLQAMPEWADQMPRSIGWGRVTAPKGSDTGQEPSSYLKAHKFASVPEMLNTLLNLPSIESAADAAAEARMIEKYGDIRNDGTLDAEVQEALHNDAKAKVLLAELKALKPKRKQLFNRVLLKAEAARIIDTMTYGQIKPGKYYRAEIRAAKRSVNAKGDEVYEAKLAQLANHYLYREAVRVRKQMELQRKSVKASQKRTYDPKIVDKDYATNYKVLANVYDMGKNPEAQQAALDKLLSWFNRQTSSRTGDDEMDMIQLVTFDPNLAKAMEAYNDPDVEFKLPTFDELTASELQGLYDQLKHLRYVGGQQAAVKSNEILAKREELAASIENNGGKEVVIDDNPDAGSKPSRWGRFRHLGSLTLSITNLLRELDGHNDKGPRIAHKMINYLLEDAQSKQLDLTMKMNEMFETELDGIEKLGLSGMGFTTAYRRANGIPVGNDFAHVNADGTRENLNPEELFMMAVYWGTESSREALMKGRNMTEEDVMKALSNLTPQQLVMVNSIWKLNETLWDELSRVSVNVYGTSPEKLDPTPFLINGVEMTGGHMRLFYNTLDEDISNQESHHYSTMMVGKTGSLISRQGSGGKAVLLDKNNIHRAMAESIHFMAFAENGKQIASIMNGKNVKAAIVKYHGKPFQKALKDTLTSIINNTPDKTSIPMIAPMMRHLRKAATYRYLVGSPRNILQQFSALPRAMHEVGTGKFTTALIDVWSNAEQSKDFVLENSAFMRNRTNLVNRETHETLTKMSVHNRRTALWAAFTQIGFMPQTFVDAQIAFPVWLAKYRESFEAHSDHRRAVSEADISVGESVGSGSDLHLGMLYNSNQGEFTKTFTMFGSFWNAQLNSMYAQTRGGREMISGNSLAATFAVPVMMSMLAAVIILDIPDEIDDPDEWIKWAAKNYAAQMGALLPIFKDLVAQVMSGFTPKNVLQSAIEDNADLIKLIASDSENAPTPLRVVKVAAEATASIVPIPLSGTVIRTIDYTDSYLQGNEGDTWNPYKAVTVGKKRNN